MGGVIIGNQLSHRRSLAVTRFSCYETDRKHRVREIVRDGERERGRKGGSKQHSPISHPVGLLQ